MQLDYMVLADYVRQDGGVVHIMGAGVDTIHVAHVPAVQPLGLAVRISFDAADPVGQEHQIRVSFVGPEKPVLTIGAPFSRPPQLPDVPGHWRTGLGIGVQLAVPLPEYGDYACELLIDDGAEIEPRSIDFRVIKPPAPGA
jgi:uncharacterized protein DUF6941